MARATGRTERSGEASFWRRVTRGLRGGRTCATCRWPAGTGRCASRGALRWDIWGRKSGSRACRKSGGGRGGGAGGRGGARAVALCAGISGGGRADRGRAGRAGAGGAADDRDGDEHGDDVLLRAPVRRSGGAGRAAHGGEFRRAGGDRTGSDCRPVVRGTIRVRYRRRGNRFSRDDGAHREGTDGALGGGGALSQYAGGGDPRDVPAHTAGERVEAGVSERRHVSEYAIAGSRGAGAARQRVRAFSASQGAAQRWRDRAGAGGGRGGTAGGEVLDREESICSRR